MITLLDICRSYDGGVTALARAMRVAEHRVYKLASGRHSRIPLALIDGVADAFGSRKVMGQSVTSQRLCELWESSRQERTTQKTEHE